MLEAGCEGLVAKDETSRYIGGPTRSWLKIKVPGWTDAEDQCEAAHQPDAAVCAFT